MRHTTAIAILSHFLALREDQAHALERAQATGIEKEANQYRAFSCQNQAADLRNSIDVLTTAQADEIKKP